jgi:Flp pilus assembly pilin Flp
MKLLRKARRERKGMGTVEWVIVAGAIALVVVGAVSLMGTRVDGEMAQTAEDVADPARLTQRFGD